MAAARPLQDHARAGVPGTAASNNCVPPLPPPPCRRHGAGVTLCHMPPRAASRAPPRHPTPPLSRPGNAPRRALVRQRAVGNALAAAIHAPLRGEGEERARQAGRGGRRAWHRQPTTGGRGAARERRHATARNPLQTQEAPRPRTAQTTHHLRKKRVKAAAHETEQCVACKEATRFSRTFSFFFRLRGFHDSTHEHSTYQYTNINAGHRGADACVFSIRIAPVPKFLFCLCLAFSPGLDAPTTLSTVHRTTGGKTPRCATTLLTLFLLLAYLTRPDAPAGLG